jgi:hypothetical protein
MISHSCGTGLALGASSVLHTGIGWQDRAKVPEKIADLGDLGALRLRKLHIPPDHHKRETLHETM